MDKKFLYYILKRAILAVVTIFLVITITFFIMNFIPGGPFMSEKSVTPETLAALNAKFGLDKPPLEQYFNYLKGAVRFDFGPSMKMDGRMVTDVILEGFATSAKMGLMAAACALTLGLVFGALAAVYHNKLIDRIIMVVSTAFVAMPSFIVATLLLWLLCVEAKVFPANGQAAGGLVLPIVSLMLYPMAYTIRLTRSSMLDVLGQDYIRTARAKGVAPSKVLFKHALKNAVTPVITYAGPMIAFILTGSLVVERIFAVPGLGKYFVSSIINRDYTMIMGTTIFLAIIVVVMMLLSDILYKLFDPRVDLS
ncbi:MAG: ABC transporter permease [Ruminococcaceae bacterium]|nr:ABC transporter permease [Oscillospiraceae bacterium]